MTSNVAYGRLEDSSNPLAQRPAIGERLAGETMQETCARLRQERSLGEPALIIIEGTKKQ